MHTDSILCVLSLGADWNAMGNLCSCIANDQPSNQQQANSQANGVKAQPSVAKAQAPSNPIDQALASAKVELEKNHHKKFDDFYTTSKLIGHGAFAKVMICTHKESQQRYAVKTVQKNLEEPAKQREGRNGA